MSRSILFIIVAALFSTLSLSAGDIAALAGSSWHSRGLDSRYIGLKFVDEQRVECCFGSKEDCLSCTYEKAGEQVVLLRRNSRYFGLFEKKGDRLVGRFHPAEDGEVLFYPEGMEVNPRDEDG